MKCAEIHTSKGVMKVDFYHEDAPGTVANFIKLAEEGYYDGLTFHRVIPDFVIQGGCPHSRQPGNPKVGTGGPGYQIPCELDGNNQYHDRGVRSEEHTSELQSRPHLVCRLLLEKKKNKKINESTVILTCVIYLNN